MSKKKVDRMEAQYEEAVAFIKTCKRGLTEIVYTAEMAIRPIVDRIIWIEQENALNKSKASAKGLPVPEPLSIKSEIDDLERLSRVLVGLRNPSAGVDNDNEAKQSMLGMVAMLQSARQKYGDESEPLGGDDLKDAIERESGGVKEAEAAIAKSLERIEYAPSTDSHRRAISRKVSKSAE